MAAALEFVTCICSTCRHETRIEQAQWADLSDDPITAANAGKLFGCFPCPECGETKADIKHPDGKRDIILAADLIRCKGKSCGHTPLSLIYLEGKNPEPEYCPDCIQERQESVLEALQKPLPKIPPEFKICPKCEEPTPTVVKISDEDGEPYIQCSNYAAFGKMNKSGCEWYTCFPPDADDKEGQAILARIRAWRKSLPDNQAKPITKNVMFALARYKPTSEAALKAIRGIGGNSRFIIPTLGKDILRIIKDT